jgi:ferredoxin
MTIFYYTSTGNSLAAARALGGKHISITQALKHGAQHYEDDVIGFVFPVYFGSVTPIMQQFIRVNSFKANYSFGIATYGGSSGSSGGALEKLLKKKHLKLNYVNALAMVDNYLPFDKMEESILRVNNEEIQQKLAEMAADIAKQTERPAKPLSLAKELSLMLLKPLTSRYSKATAKKFSVTEACSSCGICAKVCCTANITYDDTKKPVWGSKCTACMGCAQNCPQKAVQMTNQRSTARFRNAAVSLQDIIDANNRTAG